MERFQEREDIIIVTILDTRVDEKDKPSVSKLLVYRLHGDIDVPQSMVLTKRDYIDFVINLNKNDEKLTIRSTIRTTFTASSLLFIGYSFDDITLRVIFQGVISSLDAIDKQISIAVQSPLQFTKDKPEEAERYLVQYTKDMFKLCVYWREVFKFVGDTPTIDNFRSIWHHSE
jgi:hypothetical protein